MMPLAIGDPIRGAGPGLSLVGRFLFALVVVCGGGRAAADNTCEWHQGNDAEPEFAHYDSEHDDDGDGIGCDQITGLPPSEGSTVIFAEEVGVGETVDLEELEGGDLPAGAVDDDEGVVDDEWADIASVTLLVNSNFRRGPGLAYVIVGGGAAGRRYQWTQAAYGNGGYIWYELALPAGAGWVRGDLVDRRNADDPTL